MSNKAEFALALIDKLTQPARMMAKALGSIQKAEAAVSKASGVVDKALSHVGIVAAAAGADAAKGAAGFDAVARSMEKVAGRQRSLDRLSKIKTLGLAAHKATLMPEHPIGPIYDRRAQGRGGLFTRIS